MSQPKWKLVANLGDVNPLDYGGKFVFIDETGVYDPELEYLEEPCEDDTSGGFCIYRGSLERQKVVIDTDNCWWLVPFKYNRSYPHPIHQYQEWFFDSLHGVCESMDIEYDEMIKLLCSDNPIELATAYIAIMEYHGWNNFDSYPLDLTRSEAEERIAKYV